MSAPVRFLAVAVFGWVTVRAAGQVLALDPLPAIPLPDPAAQSLGGLEEEPTYDAYAQQLPFAQPPMAPVAYPTVPTMPSGYYPQPWIPRAYPMPIAYPVPVGMSAYPAALPRARQSTADWENEGPGPDFAGMPAAEDAPTTELALAPTDIGIRPRALPTFVGKRPEGRPKIDRLSLSAWALFRQPSRIVIDPRNPVAEPAGLAGAGNSAAARLARG